MNGRTSRPVRENGTECGINNGTKNAMAIQMCPTVVQTATVAITNGHSVNVAVMFETATNTVYISSHFSMSFSCELW